MNSWKIVICLVVSRLHGCELWDRHTRVRQSALSERGHVCGASGRLVHLHLPTWIYRCLLPDRHRWLCVTRLPASQTLRGFDWWILVSRAGSEQREHFLPSTFSDTIESFPPSFYSFVFLFLFVCSILSFFLSFAISFLLLVSLFCLFVCIFGFFVCLFCSFVRSFFVFSLISLFALLFYF